MRTKFFLLSALAVLLFACNGNSEIEDPTTGDPTAKDSTTIEEPTVENKGRVVGTYKCYDINHEYVKVGYFVELNYVDSVIKYHNALLCFHLEMPDSIRPSDWGQMLITPVVIPYDFTYEIFEWGEDGFEEFELVCENQDRWYPCPEDREVFIYPKK